MPKTNRFTDIPREEATMRMVNDPTTWPLLVLPLKKRTDGAGLPPLGYLTGGSPFVVYGGNIYAPSKDDPVLDTFASVEELIAAGWLVD